MGGILVEKDAPAGLASYRTGRPVPPQKRLNSAQLPPDTLPYRSAVSSGPSLTHLAGAAAAVASFAQTVPPGRTGGSERLAPRGSGPIQLVRPCGFWFYVPTSRRRCRAG